MSVLPELQRSIASVVFKNQLGCLQATYRDVALAEQYFERGVMLYAALPLSDSDGSGRIHAVRSTPLPVQYTLYADAWREGQPESGDAQSPAGLLEPRRGFGKVWRENPAVRDQLGWATQPEYGHRGVVQVFDNGTIVWLQDTDFVYVFGPDGMMTAHPRWR